MSWFPTSRGPSATTRELIGDLDDTQRQRLLLIAGRCPIHQTLTSEIHIATTLR
jgi:putative redox protein